MGIKKGLNHPKNGFTLIEVIIAITVFSIGVLSVLNLIMYNLGTIDKVQTKITATMLAKEGIELAYNIRDTNIQKGFARDCLLKSPDQINIGSIDIATADVCAMHFASGETNTVYQLSFDPTAYYAYTSSTSESGTFDKLFTNNKLYYYTGDISGQNMFWYGYMQNGLSGTEIPYARYISFNVVKDGDTTLPADKILKVESHVLYKKGGYQGEIVLESLMGNF